MVDEIVIPPTAPAASPSEAAPSAPIAPVETPSPETIIAPEAPASEPAPVEPSNVEAPVEAAKPETLLAGEKKLEEVKPEEKTPEVKKEEAPVEAKTEEIPVPVYEPFKLPEGVTVDEAKMGEYTKMLADFEATTKVPHEEMQKLGQQMVERHIQEMERYTKSLTDAWEKQANDWKDSFLKAPEFANRTDTVLNSAIDAINVYGGDSKQQEEFRSLMESSKIGNHPAMIRLLSNVMLAKVEPKQLAAPQIAAKMATSKVQKMYGKKS